MVRNIFQHRLGHQYGGTSIHIRIEVYRYSAHQGPPYWLKNWKKIEPSITIQPPPPPPPAAPPDMVAKPDDVIIDDLINIDVDINTSDGADIPEVEMEGPPVVETPDEIKDFVEV